MKIKCILIFFIILNFFSPKAFCEENFITELKGHLEYVENEDRQIEEDNAVHLEPDSLKLINISQPQKIKSDSLGLEKKNFDVFNPTVSKALYYNSERSVRPIYGGISKQSGNFTFGTEYDSYIDSAEMYRTTAIYSRYDREKFAITISASKGTGDSFSYFDNRLILAPELKITNRLSLIEKLQSDEKQSFKKHELVLRYNPKIKSHTDDIFLELGAGQTFRDNEYVKSSIRFSTKFKF